MRNLAKRLVATAGLTVAIAASMTGVAAAEPEPGCIGVPEWGGLYYYCIGSAPTATVPNVNVFGTTQVGATVPAFCYYLACSPAQPVQQSVPVNVYYTEPTASTAVIELRTNCSSFYGCYDDPYLQYTYYRVYYNAISDTCQFQTNDPTLSAVSYPRVACAL